jgi:hypothetical protein
MTNACKIIRLQFSTPLLYKFLKVTSKLVRHIGFPAMWQASVIKDSRLMSLTPFVFLSPPKPKAATGKQTNDFCPPAHHVMSSYVSVFVHSQSVVIFNRSHPYNILTYCAEQLRATVADKTILLSPRQSQLLVWRKSQVVLCLLSRCLSCHIYSLLLHYGEPESSVSTASGYGLDEREIDVRSPAEAKEFFL